MSVIPARCLTARELAMLGRNTAAKVKADKELCPGAWFSQTGDEPVELEPFHSAVGEAIRSQHVAA